MTINKAQGQTIPTVGIYLPEPVFSHGQLYVALSRGVSRQTTRILAKPNKDIDPTGKSTKNIVYRDVLEETSKFSLPSGQSCFCLLLVLFHFSVL
jgi:ATP-dependent DNA helicase PIF1